MQLYHVKLSKTQQQTHVHVLILRV